MQNSVSTVYRCSLMPVYVIEIEISVNVFSVWCREY